MHRFTSGLFVVLLSFSTVVSAREPEDPELAAYIRAHYTKFEHRIPVRDGVRLFTSVYVPNDSTTPHPILMIRTPYSCAPYGADRYPDSLGPIREFAQEGYIFVCQDVRGRFMSEGEFVNMRPHVPRKRTPSDVDESSDTFDTIEWLLEHVPANNGRVGQWGNSYPGFYSSAGMIDSHPALAAVSPNAPIADWFWDDMHHHGAFILPLAFNFFSGFGVARPEPTDEWPERFDHGTPDGYRFFLDIGPLKNVNEHHFNGEIAFWNAITEHPNYDEFWQARNILPHLKNIDCAVMTVGGLFDAEDLYGPLKTYRAIEQNNPDIFNVLVMGPWRHGGWLRTDGDTLGGADFGFKTSEIFRGRFRSSYEEPKPFVPDEVTEVKFEFQDVLHTFKRGHRVMIQIHSTWFPLVDRNPQKYVPNIFAAEEDDFITATHRVHRSSAHPTALEVGVLVTTAGE